jgi:hypothetical protein
VPGQGYVALSRLRSLDGLTLLGINNMALAIDPYVLQLNEWLQKESKKWSAVIARFGEKELDVMHFDFVKKSGGTVNEKEIKDNKTKAKEKAKYSKKAGQGHAKIPSHEITLDFVKQGLNMNQICAERGLKKETIVSHLEKIKEGGYIAEDQVKNKLKQFKPIASQFKEMKKAFTKHKDSSLTTIYRKLGGKYSFEDLRLARLFI